MKEKLSLRDKDKVVRNIYRAYQRAQLDILYFKQHYNYYPQVDLFKVKDSGSSYLHSDEVFLRHLEKKQQLEDFVGKVNQIHVHLSPEIYTFIENEYLNFYDEFWWKAYFSQSSYYRMKHKALDEIFVCASVFWDENELLEFMK